MPLGIFGMQDKGMLNGSASGTGGLGPNGEEGGAAAAPAGGTVRSVSGAFASSGGGGGMVGAGGAGGKRIVPGGTGGSGGTGGGITPGAGARTGGSGSGGGTGTGVASQTAPPPAPPDMQATVNPQLQAVYKASRQYLKDLKDGTGEEMDVMGTRLRDAAEGGRKELIDSNALAGRPDDVGVSAYDQSTQRGVQGAVEDAAIRRLGMEGGALGQLETAARTPEEMAIAEKQLGLGAYNAYNAAVQAQNSTQAAANNTAFNQMLAVLQAQMMASNAGYGGSGGGAGVYAGY